MGNASVPFPTDLLPEILAHRLVLLSSVSNRLLSSPHCPCRLHTPHIFKLLPCVFSPASVSFTLIPLLLKHQHPPPLSNSVFLWFFDFGWWRAHLLCFISPTYPTQTPHPLASSLSSLDISNFFLQTLLSHSPVSLLPTP